MYYLNCKICFFFNISKYRDRYLDIAITYADNTNCLVFLKKTVLKTVLKVWNCLFLSYSLTLKTIFLEKLSKTSYIAWTSISNYFLLCVYSLIALEASVRIWICLWTLRNCYWHFHSVRLICDYSSQYLYPGFSKENSDEIMKMASGLT